jgi:hypothetical protein
MTGTPVSIMAAVLKIKRLEAQADDLLEALKYARLATWSASECRSVRVPGLNKRTGTLEPPRWTYARPVAAWR